MVISSETSPNLMGYKPRLSVEITVEQSRKLRALLEKGEKTRIFSFLIDGLIEMLERDHHMTLAGIYSGEITLGLKKGGIIETAIFLREGKEGGKSGSS